MHQQSLLGILAKCQSKALGLQEQSVSNKDIMLLLNNVQSKVNIVHNSDSVKTLALKTQNQQSNPFI